MDNNGDCAPFGWIDQAFAQTPAGRSHAESGSQDSLGAASLAA